jgi:putative redox protein
LADYITKTGLEWIDNLTFEAEVNGFRFMIDSATDKGGANQGPRPKPLLLAALSGCSGMDVVSILKKMKVTGFKMKMEMEADSTLEHPKTYHSIRMKYLFTGDSIPPEKVITAVELSANKYCGVSAMLKNSALIKTTIVINEEEIWHD